MAINASRSFNRAQLAQRFDSVVAHVRGWILNAAINVGTARRSVCAAKGQGSVGAQLGIRVLQEVSQRSDGVDVQHGESLEGAVYDVQVVVFVTQRRG